MLPRIASSMSLNSPGKKLRKRRPYPGAGYQKLPSEAGSSSEALPSRQSATTSPSISQDISLDPLAQGGMASNPDDESDDEICQLIDERMQIDESDGKGKQVVRNLPQAEEECIVSVPEGSKGRPLKLAQGFAVWFKVRNQHEQEELSLDLYIPFQTNSRKDIQPVNIEELQPLYNFQSLRYLQITGMLRSYQKAIWKTVWRTKQLHTLILHMVFEPQIPLGNQGYIRRMYPSWKLSDINLDWDYP
jgi:hypothetical protein